MQTLDFESTAELIAQMQSPTRQRIGAMEIVSGSIGADDVSLCVDSLTGGSVVVSKSGPPS